MQQQLNEALKLSKDERIVMVQKLWDSIAAESNGADFEISEARKEVLRQRARLVSEGKMKTHSFEELENYILEQKM